MLGQYSNCFLGAGRDLKGQSHLQGLRRQSKISIKDYWVDDQHLLKLARRGLKVDRASKDPTACGGGSEGRRGEVNRSEGGPEEV